MVCTKRSRSSHQTDHDTSACQRWRLTAVLLFGFCHGERTGIAHVVPGSRDPAVGALDVGDAERVDVVVEGIGDAGHVPCDAKGPFYYQILLHSACGGGASGTG